MNQWLWHNLARLVYRPVSLRPVPGWYVGMLENTRRLSWYRRQLQRIWLKKISVAHYKFSHLVIVWQHRIKLALYPKTEMSRCLYVEGVYEPNEMCFLSEILTPGMSFVDIGANNGWFSLLAARLTGPFGKVYAIEPSQREVAKLELNIKLNNFRNISILRLALGHKQEKRGLKIAEHKNEGQNTFGSFAYDVKLETVATVETDTLDNLVETGLIRHVNVLKIDAEGSELDILRGAIKTINRFRPVVLLEVFDRSLQSQSASSDQIFAFFDKQSYLLHTFDRKSGRLIKLSRQCQNYSENMVALP